MTDRKHSEQDHPLHWWNDFAPICFDLFRSTSERYLSVRHSQWQVWDWLANGGVPLQAWNTMILVVGPKMDLQLRLIYELDSARHTLMHAFDYSLQQAQNENGLDMMEEWSNLLAGALKTHLDRLGLELGQSLPVSFRAYAYRLQRKKMPLLGLWKFELAGGTIFFELTGTSELGPQDLHWSAAATPAAEEVEFL